MNAVEVHVHNVTVNETLSKILSIMGFEKKELLERKTREQKAK